MVAAAVFLPDDTSDEAGTLQAGECFQNTGTTKDPEVNKLVCTDSRADYKVLKTIKGGVPARLSARMSKARRAPSPRSAPSRSWSASPTTRGSRPPAPHPAHPDRDRILAPIRQDLPPVGRGAPLSRTQYPSGPLVVTPAKICSQSMPLWASGSNRSGA
ncbi:LppU/SCO3897 family protein [Streptomyces rimosus]